MMYPAAKRRDDFINIIIDKTAFRRYNIIVTNRTFRGVAQLVARLLWEQDAAGSSPVTSTKKTNGSFYVSICFFIKFQDENDVR